MLGLKEKILCTLSIFLLIGYPIVTVMAAVTSNFVILSILLCIAVLALIGAIIYVLYVVWSY